MAQALERGRERGKLGARETRALDFFSPFPFLAPATQATLMPDEDKTFSDCLVLDVRIDEVTCTHGKDDPNPTLLLATRAGEKAL